MPLAELIDGKAIANEIHQETKTLCAQLVAKGITPKIVFVRVGEDPASQAYVRMKERQAKELGIDSFTQVLPESTSQSDLNALIEQLNNDRSVHGILVQSPTPHHLSEQEIFHRISYEKDVDGFHPMNVGLLYLGQCPLFKPCTPAGVHELLIRSKVPLEGAEVVVLGRGNIVGKPMAAMLIQKEPRANCTVTLIHSKSRNVAEHCKRADIVIAAMGQPKFVKGYMVKPGATVIDVGVNRIMDPSAKNGSRLVGDVDFDEVCAVAGKVTPNPGGVGPMTIAMLLSNTVRAAELANGKVPCEQHA
jgi:methylenetetrahydrofolate dehydrogenase (NADP+)/methenyltetrahydrofolate cyclohydrolase